LRLRGLTRPQKLGATKVFYNQCQLFEHMKMHGITLVDLGYLMLMPIPAGMSNSDWTPELEIACEALMEYTFILRMHIMDWLKLYKLEDKWWKTINDRNGDNIIGKVINGYKGREIFKRVEKSTANQFMDFDPFDTDISKSSDEFDDDNLRSKDANSDSVNVSDKSMIEGEDNPCMSNDITFVDCGSTPHYFEPETVESELLIEPKLSAELELKLESKSSHAISKKRLTYTKKLQNIATRRPSNQVNTSNKKIISSCKNLNLLETDVIHENSILIKGSNKKLVKPSFTDNVQQQSLLKKTENSIDESIEANEILDSPIKIDIPFSSKKHVLSKFNLDHKRNLQTVITDNSSDKLKVNKTVLAVQNPNNISRINEPSYVSNNKLILIGQNSHDIAHSKNIEKKSTKALLDNSSTGNDALSQITYNSISPRKKGISGKIMLRNGRKYLIKSAKNITNRSENSSNVSVLCNSFNISIPIDSDKSEIVDMEQTTSRHNSISSLTSSFEVVSNSDSDSVTKTDSTKPTLRKIILNSNNWQYLISPTIPKKNLETISLVEQENGDLYMDIKTVDHNIKSFSRNVCDTIFKLRQEMITEFQHLSSSELKKRMDHLQQVSEEIKKVLDFVPSNILDEKLRAINILQHILDKNFQKCNQSAKDDKEDKDDNDVTLNGWETDLSMKASHKCPICNKLTKSKSYIVGFSKLSKDEDLYCSCYKYVCHECLSCQGNMAQFIAHQNFHKKRKPYVCPDCRLKFTTDKYLEAHMWSVCFHTLKKRVFACKICEIDGLRDMESVIRHFVIMHNDTKVACVECLKVFSSYGEYKKHYTQAHSSVAKENSIRLVICKLSGIIMRYENYMSYLEDFQGIRKLIWFKCPFCPLIIVEHKHITSVFNTHLRDIHLHCLPLLISQEALNLIFRTKYANIFAKVNEAATRIPKIVNTETITSETFERAPPDSHDTWPVKSESIDLNTQATEKINKKIELSPKILDIRSITDLKRSESKKISVRTKEQSSFQTEVSKTENRNSLREQAKKTTKSDNDKSDIKEEARAANDEGNDESTTLCIPKSESCPRREINEVQVNSASESNENTSDCVSIPKANTDGRIKVVDIRKICKPDVEPFVITELCRTQMTNEKESLPTSIPKPPPLAKIPQYLLKSKKIKGDGSSNVVKSSVKNSVKKRFAIHGPSGEEDINYLCHLCGEQIDTSWPVVRTHFREKHSDEYELAIITLRLQRISPDFINGGYKPNKKRKSDALYVSKKKRRWTPKKYVDLSAPMGLCVEQETAEDGEGNFKCKRCNQRCTDMSDLRKHIAANHRLKGRYLICLECGENFVVAPSLQMHLKAFHGIEDPIIYMSQNPSYAPDNDGDSEAEGRTTVANQCHVCKAVFEDKAAVDKHLRVHGMAFLNRKRIEARNAQKTPEKNADTDKDKQIFLKDDPKESVKRSEKPAETILEKLNVS